MSRGAGEGAPEACEPIVIRNRRVCEYYARNPHVSAEAVNLVVLDLFEALGRDLTASLTNATLTDLVRSVGELHAALPARLHEAQQGFAESVRMIVGMATADNTERVLGALQRTTDGYVDQLRLHLPKGGGADEVLAGVRSELREQLAAQLSSANELTSHALEAKVAASLQPLYAFVSSSQDGVLARLDGLRDDVGTGRAEGARLSTELGEFLSRYKGSSQFKGQCSEHELAGLLNEAWPTAEVQNTTGLKGSGDFVLRREGRDDVMVENKNYEANVNLDETKKFIRDANALGTHAVMLSQRSGIASKPNYFVELNGSKVLVYVHHVNYSAEKVRLAVDLIDGLGERLREVALLTQQHGGHALDGGGGDGGCTVLSAEALANVQAEYARFVQRKDEMHQQLRDMGKSVKGMQGLLDEMRLPELGAILNKKFASASNERHVCPVCKMAFGSKRSLASHLKKHKVADEAADEGVAEAAAAADGSP